jgi:hypothetical protein
MYENAGGGGEGILMLCNIKPRFRRFAWYNNGLIRHPDLAYLHSPATIPSASPWHLTPVPAAVRRFREQESAAHAT